jgi:hypothetical protein
VGNGFPRKVVYKSKDGGNSWTDISANIPATGVGNLNGIIMHDENNGYVVTPGGYLLSTNNGGTSWELQVAHTANLFETMAFVPKTVPAGTPMSARKLCNRRKCKWRSIDGIWRYYCHQYQLY